VVLEATPLLGFAEPVSSWLHIAGALMALFATRQLARDWQGGARTSLLIFGAGAAFALAMSGAYHAMPVGGAREVLQRLDHAAIWVLIAATFTPVHVILFRGAARWVMLAFIWAFAIAGVVLKTIFFARFPETLGLLLYLAFGWVGALSSLMVARVHGARMVRPLLVGGIIYTIGGAASVVGTPPLVPGYLGHHEMFHLAVLAALYVHWQFMARLPRATAVA
jgi:channel protein (hemolysin III family)